MFVRREMAGHRILHSTHHLGVFCLSDEAYAHMGEVRHTRALTRHDPAMLAAVDALGLEACSNPPHSRLSELHLEKPWYYIQRNDGTETPIERLEIQVFRADDTTSTVYTLKGEFQDLYDAGFITEHTPSAAPKNANA